uniref:Tripartite motif-containing protein 2 n=1 Tax=Magallana gigas TaxID=29159 RepID=K1PQS6_MAGGI
MASTQQHKGHTFEEVLEVYTTKKGFIEKDADELKNLISPKYKDIALNLENQLANLNVGYKKLTSEISKQGKKWHEEIDFVIKKMKTEIKKIKMKHTNILMKHQNKIRQTQSLITQTLLTIKAIEKSTEVSSIIEYNSKIREFSKFPHKIWVSLPIYFPKPLDREKLYSLFGQITPLSTATEENVFSLNQTSNSVRKLLDEPELIATIHTEYEKLLNITCFNEDGIWISGWTNEIKCLLNNGSLLQKIKTKSGKSPNDIAVTNDGDLLYADWPLKRVYKVKKNGQTEELIRLQGWEPCNLYVTFTGDLLVTMYSDDKTQSKVVRYAGSTEKQRIQFDSEGQPLFSGSPNIKKITENRNYDICVADFWAGAVVVVNQDGVLRWRYTGHYSSITNKSLRPIGITTDSQSRVLIADCNNRCIHILTQNGQFIRYIDNCSLDVPYGLCVDNTDNLFVCELKGNIKKIKYLK